MGLFSRKPPAAPEAQFLAELTAVLADLPGVTAVEQVGPFDLVCRRRRGAEPLAISAGNLWLDLRRQTPAERAPTLDRFALSLLEPAPERWEDLVGRLRPAVRPVGWSSGHAADAGPSRSPVAPFLSGLVAIDLEQAMSFVTLEQLAAWGRSAGDVWDIAVGNLALDGLHLTPATDELERGFRVAGPPSYESSWLAVPEMLADATDELPGDVLVLAPVRNEVLLVGSDDAPLVDAALDWAAHTYANEARAISPVAYRPTTDGLVPWDPPADHPCRTKALAAVRTLALVEYRDQCAQLTDLYRRVGEDVFVATLVGVQGDDGSLWTYAVWPEAVTDGLLPAADRVSLVSDDGTSILVSFEDALAHGGGALTAEPGWEPPRWRFRSWPTAAQVEHLRTLAVHL